MTIVEGVVAVLVVGTLFGIPLFALSLRFALKPAVEAWVRVREAGRAQSPEVAALRARVAHLERLMDVRSDGVPDARLAEGTPARLRD